ncbi:MAG: aminoglycoside phosphotransferase family protein [Clostridia bacterium]
MTEEATNQRAQAIVAKWPARPALRILAALSRGAEGAAFRVAGPGGETFVLKIGDRGRIAGEARALTALAGPALVRVVDCWASEGALLIEDITPGVQLAREEDEDVARHALHAVLAGLARVSDCTGVPTLAQWLQALDPFEVRLREAADPHADAVARALVLRQQLLASAPPARLLHGDLHDQNMLSRRDGLYIAVDPKGVGGDPAYEPACFLMNRWARRCGATAAEMRREAGLTAVGAGFSPDRVWDWAFVHTALSLAWSAEDSGLLATPAEPRWRILECMVQE